LQESLDYDLIIRLKAKASQIEDKGNIPLNEKLYLGGMGSVRGFKYGTLAPRNETGALVGAEKLAAFSLELSFPLLESVQMRLLTFLDYGMTGDDKFNEIHRSSTGIGIEWAKSPLGVPLQISYAKALDAKDEDRTSRIEFSLGRRF
jgi:outer membrane protein insertion porin family